ncbi:MAG: SAM-dependent methyltransferase [Polyangiaceae bacterium]
MRSGRPSATATIVACARALAGVDPVAVRLLPPAVSRMLSVVAGARSPWLFDLASLGLVGHLSRRTKAIDRVVARAMSSGISQLVVLGAGLDARAWRMPELASAVVLEVDHPSTQAFKVRRARRLALSAREVRFVAVDFERDSLSTRLTEAGLIAERPSMWIWEGVTPYLTASAIEASLDVIAELSAAGSVLAMTYGTPDLANVPAIVKPIVAPAFGLLGEPLRGLMTPDDAGGLVRARGFSVDEDGPCADDAGLEDHDEPWFAIRERLVVATRK